MGSRIDRSAELLGLRARLFISVLGSGGFMVRMMMLVRVLVDVMMPIARVEVRHLDVGVEFTTAGRPMRMRHREPLSGDRQRQHDDEESTEHI